MTIIIILCRNNTSSSSSTRSASVQSDAGFGTTALWSLQAYSHASGNAQCHANTTADVMLIEVEFD